MNSTTSIEDNELIQQSIIARQNPRNVEQSIKRVFDIVSDKIMAEQCVYSIMSEEGLIVGGSVRLAEIVANNWGNIRVGTRLIEESDKHILVHGYAYDLETNVYSQSEVVRSRYDQNGYTRIDEHKLSVLVSSMMSIAYRNIVFKVVPFALINPVTERIKEVIIGGKPREVLQELFDYFVIDLEFTNEDVLKVVNKPSIDRITDGEIILLAGLRNSILSGEVHPMVALGKRKPIKTMKYA